MLVGWPQRGRVASATGRDMSVKTTYAECGCIALGSGCDRTLVPRIANRVSATMLALAAGDETAPCSSRACARTGGAQMNIAVALRLMPTPGDELDIDQDGT